MIIFVNSTGNLIERHEIFCVNGVRYLLELVDLNFQEFLFLVGIFVKLRWSLPQSLIPAQHSLQSLTLERAKQRLQQTGSSGRLSIQKRLMMYSRCKSFGQFSLGAARIRLYLLRMRRQFSRASACNGIVFWIQNLACSLHQVLTFYWREQCMKH